MQLLKFWRNSFYKYRYNLKYYIYIESQLKWPSKPADPPPSPPSSSLSWPWYQPQHHRDQPRVLWPAPSVMKKTNKMNVFFYASTSICVFVILVQMMIAWYVVRNIAWANVPVVHVETSPRCHVPNYRIIYQIICWAVIFCMYVLSNLIIMHATALDYIFPLAEATWFRSLV